MIAGCGLTPRPAPIETAGTQTNGTSGFVTGNPSRGGMDNTSGGQVKADTSTWPDPAGYADTSGEFNNDNDGCMADGADGNDIGCVPSDSPDVDSPDAWSADVDLLDPQGQNPGTDEADLGESDDVAPYNDIAPHCFD
ncbi:MAG: hypothetical protein KC609_03055 [Myxococcales bacterium]|nr:hypothetical protein [Myxococcales bacterium]